MRQAEEEIIIRLWKGMCEKYVTCTRRQIVTMICNHRSMPRIRSHETVKKVLKEHGLYGMEKEGKFSIYELQRLGLMK